MVLENVMSLDILLIALDVLAAIIIFAIVGTVLLLAALAGLVAAWDWTLSRITFDK